MVSGLVIKSGPNAPCGETPLLLDPDGVSHFLLSFLFSNGEVCMVEEGQEILATLAVEYANSALAAMTVDVREIRKCLLPIK